MADPVSIACAVPTLITFGIQSGKSLRNLIDTFSKHTKIARDLKGDLQALDGVLVELSETANDDIVAARLSSLKLPLHSCGQICQEFSALIQRCLSRTTDTQRSFRDWSRLQLKSDEINAFRVSLSGYKSTIQVALGVMNLRSSQVTSQCLTEYKDIIADTRADLKEQLDRIEGRLNGEAGSPLANTAYLEWVTTNSRVQEEKNTIVKCLEICEQLSADIDRHRSIMLQDVSVSADHRHESVSTSQPSHFPSGHFTTSRLEECRGGIASARKELEKRLAAIDGQHQDGDPPEEVRIRKCLDLCDEALLEAGHARVCSYEDVSTMEDSRQYIVSTATDLISAKRITTGARSVMIMGQMSDQSLQLSFQTHGMVSEVNRTSDHAATTGAPSFERYGAGRCLSKDTTSV